MAEIKDLGDIKANKEIKIEFNVPNKNYVRVDGSCGCATPIYSKGKGTITVNYVPKSIPKHLKERGYYYDEKTITAYKADSSIDIYKFKARVV